MKFRFANQTDVLQLIAMRLAFLSEDASGLSKEQEFTIKNQLAGYFDLHLEQDLIAYVAEEKEKIISTVFMLIVERPANVSFPNGKTGTLLNVYTKPEYRRQGLAETLLKMAIEDAKAMHLSFLDLKATPSGLPLYTKLGFKPEISEYTNMKYMLFK